LFSFVENTRRNFTSAAEKGITAAAMDMGYFTARSVKDTSVPALKAPIQVDLKSMKTVVVGTQSATPGCVSRRDVEVSFHGPGTPSPGTPQSGTRVNALFQGTYVQGSAKSQPSSQPGQPSQPQKKMQPRYCTADYCTGRCDAGPFCPGFRE